MWALLIIHTRARATVGLDKGAATPQDDQMEETQQSGVFFTKPGTKIECEKLLV